MEGGEWRGKVEKCRAAAWLRIRIPGSSSKNPKTSTRKDARDMLRKIGLCMLMHAEWRAHFASGICMFILLQTTWPRCYGMNSLRLVQSLACVRSTFALLPCSGTILRAQSPSPRHASERRRQYTSEKNYPRALPNGNGRTTHTHAHTQPYNHSIHNQNRMQFR